jgi:hypothetical protein
LCIPIDLNPRWIAHTGLRITESASVLRATLNKVFTAAEVHSNTNKPNVNDYKGKRKCSLYDSASKMKQLNMLQQQRNFKKT